MNFEINANTDFQDGQFLLINKPYSWTSFDVVKKIRYLLLRKYNYKKIKVGHAGTLDPLATGLVIICTGKATKKILELQNLTKEYIASLELGKTTPSFDLETDFDDKKYETDHISEQLLKQTLSTFIGESNQVPPIYSAKNIQGKRAYSYARKGQTVKLKPQKITIEAIEIYTFNIPDITIRIKCSKGTYIRALARDIGIKLQSGAYLKNLTRTAIGKYTLENSMNLEEFEKKLKSTVTN